MYKYAASEYLFDGVSNIYLISIATALLAVIMAFYCSYFLKDERQVESDVPNDSEEDDFSYLNDTKIVGRCQLKKLSTAIPLENTSDYRNVLKVCNFSTDESSDNDYNTDEIHVDGIVGKLKSKRVKDLEAKLTKDQLDEEKRIEREQLAAIYELLKKQEAELNMKEIDESELNAQLALYR